MESKGVVVIGIPYRYCSTDLYDLFSECGPIAHCDVFKDDMMGDIKDAGVIFFENEASVDFALNMDERIIEGTCLHVFAITEDVKQNLYKFNLPYFPNPNKNETNNKISTSEVGTPKTKESDASNKLNQLNQTNKAAVTKILIRTLPLNYKESDMMNACRSIRGLKSINLFSSQTERGFKNCIITFDNEKLVEAALQKLHHIRINGHKVKARKLGDNSNNQQKWRSGSPQRKRSRSFSQDNMDQKQQRNRSRSRSRSRSDSRNFDTQH